MFNDKKKEAVYQNLRKYDKTITRAKMLDLEDRSDYFLPSYMVGTNPKVEKGIGKGWLTGIMMFAPSNASGFDVCSKASKECRELCLGITSGRGVFNTIQAARIAKTRFYFQDKKAANKMITRDILKLKKKAAKLKKKLAIRLNGTSDLPAMAFKFARQFPDIQFYDYTAIVETLRRSDIPENYHLTFSRKENNQKDVFDAVQLGFNVSAVFKDELPDRYLNLPVFDADKTDLRFLDPAGIAGLMVKGNKGKKTDSTFLIGRNEVLQAEYMAARKW